MAKCVISSIVDTDHGRVVPACMVHAAYAPCHHNGEPACSTPLHADTHLGCTPVFELWMQRTRGQRRLVLHNGRLDETHDTTDHGAICWCKPEVLGGDHG
jgi:hypothetical protein